MPPANVDPSDKVPTSTIKLGLQGIGSAFRTWFKGGSTTSQPSTPSTPVVSTPLPHNAALPKAPPQTLASEFRRPSTLSQKGIVTRGAVAIPPRDVGTLKQSSITPSLIGDDSMSPSPRVDVSPVEIPCVKLPRSRSAEDDCDKSLPSIPTAKTLAAKNLVAPSPIPTVHARNISQDLPPSPPSMTPRTIPGRPSPAISTPPTTLLPVPSASKSSTQSGLLPPPQGSQNRNSAVSTGLPLATARMIQDLRSISYPKGIARPSPELNVNTKPGKFIYDRPFLLQFMAVCTERPGILVNIVDKPFAPDHLTAHAKPATLGRVTTINFTLPSEMAESTPPHDPSPNTVHDPAMSFDQPGPTTQISGQSDPPKKRTARAKHVTPGGGPMINFTLPSEIAEFAPSHDPTPEIFSSTPPSEMAEVTPPHDPTPNTVHDPDDPAMPSDQPGPTTQISGKSDPPKKRTRTKRGGTKRGGRRDANDGDSADDPTDQVAEGQVVSLGVDERISRDIQELFSVRDINWSEAYFIKLPSEHHPRLVCEMVSKAVRSTEDDGELVADVLARAARKWLCSAPDFEKGFLPVAELLDHIAIGCPEAFQIMAMMMKGAGLDKDEVRRTRIAQKSENHDILLEILAYYSVL